MHGAPLSRMQAAGLRPNWGTALLGLTSVGQRGQLLTLADVDAFATERLATDEAAAVRVLAELSDGLERTREVLRELALRARSDAALEARKWRALLLEDLLAALKSERDPTQGLIRFTEFWAEFDYPLDSPHTLQGVGNTMTPDEYYTEEVWTSALARHHTWLQDEMTKLRDAQ
ncbi:MAG: DUF2247 family protein [Myxococcota bacterium]